MNPVSSSQPNFPNVLDLEQKTKDPDNQSLIVGNDQCQSSSYIAVQEVIGYIFEREKQSESNLDESLGIAAASSLKNVQFFSPKSNQEVLTKKVKLESKEDESVDLSSLSSSFSVKAPSGVISSLFNEGNSVCQIEVKSKETVLHPASVKMSAVNFLPVTQGLKNPEKLVDRKNREPQQSLLLKLSVGLLATYKNINAKYFEKKRSKSQSVDLSVNVESQSKEAPAPSGYESKLSQTIEFPSLIGHTFKGPIGQASFIKKIGEGAYGDVYEGTYTPPNGQAIIKVALKVNQIFISKSETKLVLDSLLEKL